VDISHHGNPFVQPKQQEVVWGILVGWGRYRCGLAQVDDGHSSFVAVEAVEVTAFYSYIPLM